MPRADTSKAAFISLYIDLGARRRRRRGSQTEHPNKEDFGNRILRLVPPLRRSSTLVLEALLSGDASGGLYRRGIVSGGVGWQVRTDEGLQKC